MKKLILIAFTVLSLGFAKGASSPVEFTWFGTSNIAISDGESTLLFDPFFSRAPLYKILSFWPLESNPKIIKRWLSPLKLNSIAGIFVSHTHYDHALDLVNTAKLTKAKIYGSSSAGKIAAGGAIPSSNFHELQIGEKIKVGSFTLTVMPGVHASHFWETILASGPILKPLVAPASAYSFKAGLSFSFLIQHSGGTLLFHPSGVSHPQLDLKNIPNVDVVILGVASRKSSEDLIQKVLQPLKGSPLVIPVHYDRIDIPLENGPQVMKGVQLGEFLETLKVKNLSVRTLLLPYGTAQKVILQH